MSHGFFHDTIGPEIALGRRGCTIETCLRPRQADAWVDTHFADAAKRDHGEVENALKQYGEELLCIIRRVDSAGEEGLANGRAALRDELHTATDVLLDMGVLFENADHSLHLECKAQLGSTFENLVGVAFDDLRIAARREVKVRYPYAHPYDPDGQRYDIIAALDLSNYAWIECKKPLYGGGPNPLSSVLCRANLAKFIRRAWWLKPKVAVFLVDTLEDYSSVLEQRFSDQFIHTSQCYLRMSNIYRLENPDTQKDVGWRWFGER
jgi:hypothetical protein